jgi:hypothetical protein
VFYQRSLIEKLTAATVTIVTNLETLQISQNITPLSLCRLASKTTTEALRASSTLGNSSSKFKSTGVEEEEELFFQPSSSLKTKPKPKTLTATGGACSASSTPSNSGKPKIERITTIVCRLLFF